MVGEAAGATEETGPGVVVKVLDAEDKLSSTVKYVKMGQARLSRGKAGGPDIQTTPPLHAVEAIGGLGDRPIFVLTEIHALGRTD